MKKIFFSAFLITALISFSSCNSSTDSNNAPPLITRAPGDNNMAPEVTYNYPDIEDDMPVTEEVVTRVTIEEDPESIRSGTWFYYDPAECGYYFFDNYTKEGARIDVNDGVTIAFKYTMSDDGKHMTFRMNNFDETVSIDYVDPYNATLTVPDKVKQSLTYISPQCVSEFAFYTDEELGAMAVRYFEDHSVKRLSNLRSLCTTGEDTMVTIQVHIITGTGDMKVHETYMIDRTTATGTDSSGNPVDLK